MKVSFFEEFPNKKNLEKLKLLPKTKVYLAAKSIDEFRKITKGLKGEFVYWPILAEKYGYWISPWSEPDKLKKLFEVLEKSKVPVMLDLEPPKHRWQIFTKLQNFQGNRKLIKKFIKRNRDKVYTVERAHIPLFFSKIMGLSYPSKRILMYYTSFFRPFMPDHILLNRLKKKAEYCADNDCSLAIGLIATGIHGFEPVYGAKELNEDLQIAKKAGVKEIIIFRLGGLNKELINVIKANT